MVSPARRRAAVALSVRRHPLSEVGRASWSASTAQRSGMRSVAAGVSSCVWWRGCASPPSRHPRYGYRRIWALLRREGWEVNRKRIERLWRLEGHRCAGRSEELGRESPGRTGRGGVEHAGRQRRIMCGPMTSSPRAPEDGVAAAVPERRRRVHRRWVGCRVERHLGAREVTERARAVSSRPTASRRVHPLRQRQGVHRRVSRRPGWRVRASSRSLSRRGAPQQNPYVERFNGTMRDELLNGEHFRQPRSRPGS